MEKPKKAPAASVATKSLPESAEAQHAMQLLHMARADIDSVLKKLGTHPDGLSEAEAHARLKQYGEQ